MVRDSISNEGMATLRSFVCLAMRFGCLLLMIPGESSRELKHTVEAEMIYHAVKKDKIKNKKNMLTILVFIPITYP